MLHLVAVYRRKRDVCLSHNPLQMTAVQPFDNHEVRRFAVEETSIEVIAAAVLPLTMSLNELCTNAVKYGALSNATGRIAIAVTADDMTQRLKVTWTETGGPTVRKPTQQSFGTRLITRLTDQLHGTVRLRYEPTGFVYELDAPLSGLRG